MFVVLNIFVSRQFVVQKYVATSPKELDYLELENMIETENKWSYW